MARLDTTYGEDLVATLHCPKHGDQEPIEMLRFTGFAGGNGFAYKLLCGCISVDEDDDVRAAC